MAKPWSMDLSNYVPQIGATVDEGNYLTEIAFVLHEKVEKGNRFKVIHRIVEGTFKGKTLNVYLYVIDDEFKGNDGHKAVTLDNWYSLFIALGVEPRKVFKDMRKVADKLVGRKVGVSVENSVKKGDEGKPKEEQTVYSNIRDFLNPVAVSGVEETTEPDEDEVDWPADDAPVDEPDDTDEIADTDEDDEFDLDDIT